MLDVCIVIYNRFIAVLKWQHERFYGDDGVTSIWGTVLKGHSIGQVENNWLRESLSFPKIYSYLRMYV